MSDQMKHQRNRNRSRPGRIVAAVAAIIAVAAIAVGVRFYEKSGDPSGPPPVHLPATPQSSSGCTRLGYLPRTAG